MNNNISVPTKIKKVMWQCRYCGYKSVLNATTGISTIANCPKHPSGWCKGQHSFIKTYFYANQYGQNLNPERKVVYVCTYCGNKSQPRALTEGVPSISNCNRHPKGFCKGPHHWTRVFINMG